MFISRVPYRPVSLVLGVLFLLFTAGLPVALTFCPMSDAMGDDVCPMCMNRALEGPADTVAFNNDTSCCTTVTSATNDAEFLHTRTVLDAMQKSIPALLIVSPPAPVGGLLADYCFTHEVLLTRSDDIPIRVSSLLI